MDSQTTGSPPDSASIQARLSQIANSALLNTTNVANKFMHNARDMVDNARKSARMALGERDYMNPLKCEIPLSKCHLFIYFAIGMILLMAVLLYLHGNSCTSATLAISVVSMCIIFAVSSLILLNLCAMNSPEWHSYAVMAGAVVVTLLVCYMAKKN
jgi:VIT1/CCC1 family predicted Fe2+/Mn2+ transporter